MDFKQKLKDSANESSSNSSSSSSSSSSSNKEDGVKYEWRVPYLVIYQDKDGNWGCSFNDQRWAIEFKKPTPTKKEGDKYEEPPQSYEIETVPEGLVKYWWSVQDVQRAAHMVEQELGLNFKELLEDDPEKLKKAINRAAKSYSPQTQPARTESCPVCRQKLHVINGDYEIVDGRRVCPHHTAKELSDSGLI